MKKSLLYKALIIILFMTVCSVAIAEEDIKASKDHPAVSRFPGAYIINYEVYKFDEFFIPLGAVEKIDGKYQHKLTEEIAGKVTRITYFTQPETTSFEIFKSYENALEKAGFDIVFKCSKDDCGSRWQEETYFLNELNIEVNGGLGIPMRSGKTKDQRYIAAKMNKGKRDIYISLYISAGYWDHAVYQLDIIETAELEKGQVDISPEASLAEINQKGHVAVYGITFDTGKAEIKDESAPAVKKIADILALDKSLRIYIVGHTDDTGGFQLNMRLSDDRAKAISRYLQSKYGIDGKRLEAYGVGPLVPKATNETPDGRAQNRRVELVKIFD